MDAACDSVQVQDCQEPNQADHSTEEKIHDAGKSQNCSVDTPSVDSESEKQVQARCNDTTAREVAIQANVQDIESSSSQPSSRRRYIPLKLNDYRVFAGGYTADGKEEEEEEEEDATFDPGKTYVKKLSNSKTQGPRGRGRPRKNPPPTAQVISEATDTPQEKRNVILKVSSGFKCGVCARVFSLRGNAKAHLITHTDQRPFSCDFEGCRKQLRTKESLRRHQLSHLGIKMFECTDCKKKFSCNASLREHMSRHSGEKPLSCNICGRKFRQVAVLKRHIITHSSDKPFACGVCGKRFAMKTYVQSHMKTHTGERPYTCDTCNKSFAHASDLNRHKVIHTGKKPYACSVCSMRYSDASSRRRHEQEHQSRQQYLCHLCNQLFTRAGQLRSHLMREHNSETDALFEVQIVDKGSKSSAEDSRSQPKLVSMLQNVHPNIVVQELETVSQSDQGNEVSSEIAQSSPAVQVLVEATELAQSVSETNLVNNDGASQEVSKTLSVSTESTSADSLPTLRSGCTYRILGHVVGNQVYELKLEDGGNIPFEDLATQVNLSDVGLQGNETSLTVIKQDENTLTVIQEPSQAEKNILASEQIGLDSLLSWQTESNDAHQTTEKNHSVGKSPSQEKLTVSLAVPSNQTVISIESDSKNVQQESQNDLEVSLDNTRVDESTEQSSVVKNNSTSTLPLGQIPVTQIEPPNYIEEPDLNSQDYYNWLSNFTEECKFLPMPLDKEMFQKISHVQKTLSDFMALPSGVITDKNNFKVLMSITQDLSDITSAHLKFMFQHLS